MILVDSSVWIEYLNNTSSEACQLLENAITKEEIVIGDLILVEVLQGIAREDEFLRVKRIFEDLHCFSMLGVEIALVSIKNYRYLRAKGITVRKTIDCLIATFCIENNLTLLHNDRDFFPFKQHLGLLDLSP